MLFMLYLIGVLVGLSSYLFLLSYEAMENNLSHKEYEELYKKTIIPALFLSLIPFGGYVLGGLLAYKIFSKGVKK